MEVIVVSRDRIPKKFAINSGMRYKSFPTRRVNERYLLGVRRDLTDIEGKNILLVTFYGFKVVNDGIPRLVHVESYALQCKCGSSKCNKFTTK